MKSNKKILFSIFCILLVFVGKTQAQMVTPPTIVKENYTVTGTVNLIASESITLKPETWIKSGSNFSASILDDAYIPILFSNENYIFTQTYQVPTQTGNIILNSDVHEGIKYFDGLGRVLQEKSIKQSPNRKDVVQHFEYDAYGRQTKEYLPYASSINNGLLEGNAAATVHQFYNTTKYENTLNPYIEKRFEQSPLNRILLEAASGNSWSMGSGHEIKMHYDSNSSEEVKLFKVSLDANYNPTLTGGNWYAAGQLIKVITKDENWKVSDGLNKTTEQFKDKAGKVILDRKYNEGERLDTYYVYDIYDNLTFVISPKVGVHASTLTQIREKLEDLCYIHKYDSKNRVVEKKDPQKGWEYIVYDKLDRPVLTQDALQRAKATKEWLFNKYDQFGREVYTGIYKTNDTRTQIQTAIDNHAVLYEQRGSTFDNYTNNAFPTVLQQNDIFTYTYYDNYTFDLEGVVLPSIVYGKTVSTNVKGLVTGTKTKVLGTSSWITSVTGYDDKEQVICISARNKFLNTTDIVKSKLDFVGKILETTSIHTSSSENITVIDKYNYDHAGRLLSHKQKINNRAEELIAKNGYDELGVLISKKVGKSENNYLQSIDYTYSIRGWLKNINNDTANDNDLFNFNLKYNDISDNNLKLYNGNISKISWSTLNQDQNTRYYQFTYDDVNRLKSAVSNDNKYNVTGITYDANGNIEKLKRNGWQDSSTFTNMDDLVYTYNEGNQLTKVQDNGSNQYGFKDNANTDSEEYLYDINGNLTRDTNKKISNIVYNHLNLPTKVYFAEGRNNLGSIEYTYDANGVKLQKKVEKLNGTRPIIPITQYAGAYVYKNNVLDFFGQAEGYIKPIRTLSGVEMSYVYQYKDHLGNVRLSYTDTDNNGTISQSEIIEENNYYPFGLKQKGYNDAYNPLGSEVAKQFKYNGKELEENLGYNMYEMDVRSYDPAIARWVAQDPVLHHDLSPYNAFDNNPVFFADPSGADSDGGNFGIGRTRGDREFIYTQGFGYGYGVDLSSQFKSQIRPNDGFVALWDFESNSYSYTRVSGEGGNEYDTITYLGGPEMSDLDKMIGEYLGGTTQTINNPFNSHFSRRVSPGVWESSGFNGSRLATGATEGFSEANYLPIPFVGKALGWAGSKLWSVAQTQFQNAMIRYSFRIVNPHLTSEIVKKSLARFDYSKPFYRMLRRAPKGGIRIHGKKYLGGQILPFPRIYYGRGATFISEHAFFTSLSAGGPLGLKPWARAYISNKYKRWITATGLSAAGYYFYDKKMSK